MNDLSQIMTAVGAENTGALDLSQQANAIADKVMRSHELITLPKPEIKLDELKVYKLGYLPAYIPNAGSSSYMSYSSIKVSASNQITHNNPSSPNLKIYALVWLYNCWYDGFSAFKNYRYNDTITGAPLVSPHSVFKQIFTPGTAETKTFTLRFNVFSASAIKVKIYYDGSVSYYFRGFEVDNTNNKVIQSTAYNSSLKFPCGINIPDVNSIQLNKTSNCVYLLFENNNASITDSFTAPSAGGSFSYQLQYRQNFTRFVGYQPLHSTIFKTFYGSALQSGLNRSMSDWFTNYANVTDYADDIVSLNTAVGTSTYDCSNEYAIVLKKVYMLCFKNYNTTNASFSWTELLVPAIEYVNYNYNK